jgi:hypothetical protein
MFDLLSDLLLPCSPLRSSIFDPTSFLLAYIILRTWVIYIIYMHIYYLQGAGFDAGGFCQFMSDEATSVKNSAEAYNIPVAMAGFCEDTPAGDRGAACLMSGCSNLADTCFPKDGDFQMFYGGLGYNYPEAWTTNWLPGDATTSFVH